MKRTLYLLTRHYDRRNGDFDEFVKEWFFKASADQVILESDERKIVFLHGSTDRFPEGLWSDYQAFIDIIRDVIQQCQNDVSGEIALLCHAKNPDLPLQSAFRDFAFASVYSIGASLGEWPKIQGLKGTYSHLGTPQVTNPIAFAAAFDTIWQHFQPNEILLKKIIGAHAGYAAKVVPTFDKTPQRNVTIESYTNLHNRLESLQLKKIEKKAKKEQHEPGKISGHTDYYLVIWNDISSLWFCDRLRLYLLAQKGISRPAHFLTVTSQTEFEIVNWTRDWETVFVLAESFTEKLGWEGVSLLRLILEARGIESSPLKIFTTSVVSRKALYDHSGIRNRRFVRTFPHLQLPLSADAKISFSDLGKVEVSKRKWQSKYRELTDDRQILDSIRHNLEKLLPGGELGFDAKQAKEILEELLGFRSALDLESFQLAREIKTQLNAGAAFTEIAVVLQNLLHSLYRLIREQAAEENPVLLLGRKDARIMIVEDDPMTARQIEAYFASFFQDKPTLFQSGAKALAELKVNGKRYAALIADLELLDEDKLEDFVQGADLVDYCENYCSHISIRVISRLSPTSVAKRLPGFENDKIVRKRSDTSGKEELVWLYDEADFFKKLFIEIDEKASKAKYQGPEHGKFGVRKGKGESPKLTEYYYWFRDNRREEFEAMIRIVESRALAFLENPKQNPVETKLARPVDNLDATWHPLLGKLLTLRLIFLGRQKDDGYKMKYADVPEFEGLFFDLGWQLNEKRGIPSSKLNPFLIEILGLEIEWPDVNDRTFVKINCRDRDTLFPHEWKFLREHNRAKQITLASQWSKKLCNNLLALAEEIKSKFETEKLGELLVVLAGFIERPTFEDLVELLQLLPQKGGEPDELIQYRIQMIDLINDAYDNPKSGDAEDLFFTTPELDAILEA